MVSVGVLVTGGYVVEGYGRGGAPGQPGEPGGSGGGRGGGSPGAPGEPGGSGRGGYGGGRGKQFLEGVLFWRDWKENELVV